MTLHDYLFTLLLAMAPVSELRGAIPFGLAHDIPQALLYPSCILANLLPVPFVILFLRRILAWMQRKGGRARSSQGKRILPAHTAAGEIQRDAAVTEVFRFRKSIRMSSRCAGSSAS